MVLAPSEQELAGLEKVIPLEQSRIQTISEISSHIDYFSKNRKLTKNPNSKKEILIPQTSTQ